MSIDATLFTWINGLAGHSDFLDELARGLANDYFTIVSCCLVLLALWFGAREPVHRLRDQLAVICASISLGISQGMVGLSNVFYFRERPFIDLPTHLLFYRPTDSSFPSNAASIIFGLAFGVFMWNRKAGVLLLVLAALHGFSRVYVGVHYPLDVVAGALIGGIVAATVYLAMRQWQFLFTKLLEFLQRFQLA